MGVLQWANGLRVMFHGQWVSNIVQFSETLLSIYTDIHVCVYTYRCMYIAKEHPSPEPWPHHAICEFTTPHLRKGLMTIFWSVNLCLGKALTRGRATGEHIYRRQGESTVGSWRVIMEEEASATKDNAGNEKSELQSAFQSGENYLGRLRRPSSVMGLSGQRGWKKGLRSRRLLSTHHALLLTLADLTRGELLHQGRHVLLNFFCVQTQRRKRAIEDFGNKEIILKSWGYQCHSQWIHALCQGKVRASELSVNPQTAMFHIYHDKLQRCLLTLKQIQTNSGRAKQNGKKKLAWSLPEVTNNNQFFLEVLQVSIRSAINRWLRFKTWNHP